MPSSAGSTAAARTWMTSRQATWQNEFDYRVAEDRAAAEWIEGHGLRSTSAVIWSADVWLYSISDFTVIMPTPPIYNDATLLGSYGAAAQRIAALAPEIVVTEGTTLAADPEIRSEEHTSELQS